MRTFSDGLEQRFERLKIVVRKWENRMESMPRQMLELFDQEDLSGIESLLIAKKQLREQTERLRQFIQKWESPNNNMLGVMETDDENVRSFF
ncbi:hypothetical protein [Effusibacillus dendaii]|uniref:Uncharacterized protein n=1 Tax=Effusibacillus dendaii TaxID=2743772 RepID=A0A7I8D952_9BACL|nr:hypothetical protein [Effusibacillus dendaii]BCJ85346.1 hypothetical protein skT53_03310 [Effusibacillus dendaii]